MSFLGGYCTFPAVLLGKWDNEENDKSPITPTPKGMSKHDVRGVQRATHQQQLNMNVVGHKEIWWFLLRKYAVLRQVDTSRK